MGLVRETERARGADELAQGDIIRVDQSPASSGAPKLGVIINADCDLAHGKTDGVVAYLPIYTFREYLEFFWAPVHVDEVARIAAIKVLEIIGDKIDSLANLKEMLRSLPQVQVVQDLSEAAALKKSDRLMLANHVSRLGIASNEAMDLLQRFSLLCQNERDPERHARKQIVDARRAMGDGHFFVSEIVDQTDLGFVVRMRRIWTLPVECCFRTIASQRARSGGEFLTAARIAKLTPLYRFKVLQLFAQQYSRIGLPDEITALGELAIEDLVQSLAGATA